MNRAREREQSAVILLRRGHGPAQPPVSCPVDPAQTSLPAFGGPEPAPRTLTRESEGRARRRCTEAGQPLAKSDLESIFRSNRAGLSSYLRGMLPAADAEELLSEVFVVALRRRTTYDHTRSSVSAWLFGIAFNLVRRHRREEARRSRAYLRLAAQREAPAAATEDIAADRLDAVRLRATLTQVLQRIGEPSGEILRLQAMNLSYLQIASALDVPVGTVRSRLSRARHKAQVEFRRTLGGAP